MKFSGHKKSNLKNVAGVLLAVPFLVAVAGTCDQKGRINNRNSQPKTWRKVNLSFLTLSVPSNMRERKVPATDLTVWEFHSDLMVLEIDYGQTVSNGQEYRQQPDFKEDEAAIGGFTVVRSSFRLDGSVPTNYYNRGFKFVATAFFPDVDDFGNKLMLFANCKNAECIRDANQIFNSVKIESERE